MDLAGNVNAFEFAGGVGVTFGYNSNGQDNGVGVSANVQVSWADMDLLRTDGHGSDDREVDCDYGRECGANEIQDRRGRGFQSIQRGTQRVS